MRALPLLFVLAATFASVGTQAQRPGARPPVKKAFVQKAPVKKTVLKSPGAKKPAAKKLLVKKPLLQKRVVISKAPAQSFPPNTKALLQAKYDQLSTLVMRKDVPRLANLFLTITTKDFLYVDKKGKRFNRVQLLGQMKMQMRMVKRFSRSGNKVKSFVPRKIAGTVSGVATIISDFAMVFPDARGKAVRVSGQSTTADTWVRTAGGLKLRAIRTLKESVKYNGKPM